MADEPLESGQAGEQELPTPSFSGSGGSSTSSGADELVSKLIAQLEPIIEKKVQSVKDKRFSEFEKVLGGRDKMLAELEADGVTIPKEVRTQMQIRELQERLTQQTTQPTPVSDDGTSQQKVAVAEAVVELKEAGLTTDDPDFLNLLRGNYASREAFDLAVQKHINQKLRPPKPASPADVVQSPATSSTQPGDTATLIDELSALQKNPSKHRERIAALKKELDKRDWK